METLEHLYVRAAELLNIIAMEFSSDPTSVQCFDLRLVQESIEVSTRIRQLCNARDLRQVPLEQYDAIL
jgi:hypothetical protein